MSKELGKKIVIRCVPAVRYEGARAAAAELGVSYASLYAYLAYGTPSIGPEKRARLEIVGEPVAAVGRGRV